MALPFRAPRASRGRKIAAAPRRHAFLVAFAAALLAAALLAPASLASDVTDIGYLDQGALASIPSFVAANRELQAYKATLDHQFASAVRRVRDPNTQARIAQQYQNEFAKKQAELLEPLLARAQVAIASVASSRNLSVIVDKQIIIYGGQDVTGDVINLLTGPGDPIPPVSTPPPSAVGYVDQSKIDAVPKVKAANDQFAQFQKQQQALAQKNLRAAKSDAQRQAALRAYRDALASEQKTTIQPLVDATRTAIADVARKRGLVLVIDKSNLIFGGTDITDAVTSDLQ